MAAATRINHRVSNADSVHHCGVYQQRRQVLWTDHAVGGSKGAVSGELRRNACRRLLSPAPNTMGITTGEVLHPICGDRSYACVAFFCLVGLRSNAGFLWRVFDAVCRSGPKEGAVGLCFFACCSSFPDILRRNKNQQWFWNSWSSLFSLLSMGSHLGSAATRYLVVEARL